MADRLHLSDRHRRTLKALFNEHLPGVEVWAYGSRVNGGSHDGSDLDLVLRGPELEEIPAGRLAEFEEAVRKSTIPFPVEARDWTRLPDWFHQDIETEHVVLVVQPEFKDGHNPSRWRNIPLSEAILVNPSVPLKRGRAYPHIAMAELVPGMRSVTASTQREYRGSGSRFVAGDTLMARITPCLENGKIAKVDSLVPNSDGLGFGLNRIYRSPWSRGI